MNRDNRQGRGGGRRFGDGGRDGERRDNRSGRGRDGQGRDDRFGGRRSERSGDRRRGGFDDRRQGRDGERRYDRRDGERRFDRRDDRGGSERRYERREGERSGERSGRNDRRGYQSRGERRPFDRRGNVRDGRRGYRPYDSEREAARIERAQEIRQEREAVRRAINERPRDGYSLADFDDIPFHPQHRPEAAAPKIDESVEGVRLQKALANAGVASRRASENLIIDGKVRVNGKRVTELGTRIDPERDKVSVNGTPVQFDQSRQYFMLNKPTGVVCTMHDDAGRPDLRQFTKHIESRVYNVGRLDGDTSGLLILTNDGELAHVLAHPSFGVTKTYVAKVRGKLSPGTMKELLDGIHLEDGFIKADSGHIVDRAAGGRSTIVEITLHSGRNRIVRRMFDHVGHPVESLVRRSFGPLQLGTLRSGDVRELSAQELGKLLKLGRRAEHAATKTADGATAEGAASSQPTASEEGTNE